MQGISVITNPQGQPKTLTIDVEQHDQQLDPFVRGLLNLLQQTPPRHTDTDERAESRAAAHAALNRTYSDDEPDYSDIPAYTSRKRS